MALSYTFGQAFFVAGRYAVGDRVWKNFTDISDYLETRWIAPKHLLPFTDALEFTLGGDSSQALKIVSGTLGSEYNFIDITRTRPPADYKATFSIFTTDNYTNPAAYGDISVRAAGDGTPPLLYLESSGNRPFLKLNNGAADVLTVARDGSTVLNGNALLSGTLQLHNVSGPLLSRIGDGELRVTHTVQVDVDGPKLIKDGVALKIHDYNDVNKGSLRLGNCTAVERILGHDGITPIWQFPVGFRVNAAGPELIKTSGKGLRIYDYDNGAAGSLQLGDGPLLSRDSSSQLHLNGNLRAGILYYGQSTTSYLNVKTGANLSGYDYGAEGLLSSRAIVLQDWCTLESNGHNRFAVNDAHVVVATPGSTVNPRIIYAVLNIASTGAQPTIVYQSGGISGASGSNPYGDWCELVITLNPAFAVAPVGFASNEIPTDSTRTWGYVYAHTTTTQVVFRCEAVRWSDVNAQKIGVYIIGHR